MTETYLQVIILAKDLLHLDQPPGLPPLFDHPESHLGAGGAAGAAHQRLRRVNTRKQAWLEEEKKLKQPKGKNQSCKTKTKQGKYK